MNAKDLRIGNYVRLKKNVTIDENIVVVTVDNLNSYPLFNPVNLTEQWLIDFGFEKWTWCDDSAIIPLYFGNHLYCRFFNDQWHIKTIKVGRDKNGFYGKSQSKYLLPKGKIKHVHQLQNLYHALTGNELTLKQ